MEGLVAGDVALLYFPNSRAAEFKKRPGLVMARIDNGFGYDYLMAMISTRARPDPASIPVDTPDLTWGRLKEPSLIRPTYLFTADPGEVFRQIGHVPDHMLETAKARAIAAIRGDGVTAPALTAPAPSTPPPS